MRNIHTDRIESTPLLAANKLHQSDYHHFMIRELLIWVVGVPVPVAAIIGFFVL